MNEERMDHFQVFGLERRLTVDEADLQKRFYELSRRHHPDFHQGGSPDEQARSLEASARINAAYRILRDPVRRVEYLVRLEGGIEVVNGNDGKARAPAGLIAEMFEIQEALQEAREGALDESGRAALAEQLAGLRARYAEVEARLRGPLARAWDEATPGDRPRVLAACVEALAARAYLRTVIDDLSEALGEGQEHVAHHRD
jgi:molecular chaperone HscB